MHMYIDTLINHSLFLKVPRWIQPVKRGHCSDFRSFTAITNNLQKEPLLLQLYFYSLLHGTICPSPSGPYSLSWGMKRLNDLASLSLLLVLNKQRNKIKNNISKADETKIPTLLLRKLMLVKVACICVPLGFVILMLKFKEFTHSVWPPLPGTGLSTHGHVSCVYMYVCVCFIL